MDEKVKLFDQKKIRSHWDADLEKWFFVITDIVGVLTESPNPRKYWSVLKGRLKKEGSQLTTVCSQLKMIAADGKSYLTDVADTEQTLRLIQSIPSPKAEPFKLWLASVGNERINETENPELTFDRAMKTYLQKGYSKAWINQRLKSIEIRKELTDEWENRGVKAGKEFATLTDIITRARSEKSVKEYKEFKNLKKENLRDNMTNLELVLNMLAEATTSEISKEKLPATFEESKDVATAGGSIAGNTRKEIEAKTGKRIVSPDNARSLGNRRKPDELQD
ncbi:BRO-N domain-containing protein [Dyadobacter chenhuakuii]|uniref:Bro-N domain-containing protein n=1 Tax=Dyadobacter chenhuakuii TaxID=2909339 RepID=A0A9X1QF89_9BACT|nr:Bro-N domain-containing protein [Dyadobacter chenhuakuii]MCF2500300.1 Bro-N domain-containing protein [Dyadobacter chenhuakuii]